MSKQTYISELNGVKLFAERADCTRNGVNIDSKFAEIEREITAAGAFEVVPLTSGVNPVPDVAEPRTTIIYLTKESGSAKTDPYTEWIYIPADTTKVPPVTAHWEVIGETSMDLSGYKTKQDAVSFTGGTLKSIASFSQDANGKVTITFNDIQNSTTSQKGVVQLEDSHTSTSTTTAATPKNVKEAYDLASSKQDAIAFDGTYNASTNKAATVSTVTDAVNALDAVKTSTDGNNVQVKVTEVDGKVTAVNIVTDNTASAPQGAKADSAIQGVSVANGTATPTVLTPDANKVVVVPVATPSAYGVMTYSTIELDEISNS